MSEHPTCRHPDRDVPKLMCGYPLPCPWHTVTIDVSAGTVTIPIASDALKSPMRERVGEVARLVVTMPDLIEKVDPGKNASKLAKKKLRRR